MSPTKSLILKRIFFLRTKNYHPWCPFWLVEGNQLNKLLFPRNPWRLQMNMVPISPLVSEELSAGRCMIKDITIKFLKKLGHLK